MKKRYLLPVLLFAATSAFGQAVKSVKADKYYEAYQFAAAVKAYEKALILEPGNAALLAKVVQCYIKLGNAERAKYWLDKAAEATASDAQGYRELAAVLATDARYAAATQLYDKAAATNDQESIKWQKAYKNLGTFYEDSALYNVKKVSFNSGFSDFSPAFFGNGVVFSSPRSNTYKADKASRNYTGFIDLFYAEADATAPIPFSTELNSKYHEGPLSFNGTQDTVYFTRSNFEKKSFSKTGVNNLHIYTAVLKNGKWESIKALPFNSTEYSTGHPALADSHTLYFVSDMPGGFGGTDLYKTVKVGGEWQTPVNLGPEINTSGNEMFPFVDEHGNLYFASNGHPGLGGLDIFVAQNNGKTFGGVKSVGYPINTPGDDFGLIIKGDAGYYNSNYKAAHDDIYTFKVTRQKQVVLLALDHKGKPLNDVQLVVNTDTKSTLGKTPAQIDWTYGKLEKLALSKKGYASAELLLAKSDFFKYNALDTIRVVMAKKVIPADDRKVQVALHDEDGKPVVGGKIELIEAGTGLKKVYEVEERGFAVVTFAPVKNYKLRGVKQGFYDTVLNLDPKQITSLAADEELNLRLRAKELFNAMRVGETIELEIEYDLAKADIRLEAAQILDKLVAYLQKYTEVKVELGAHTDSRGSDVYNQALSQRRAEAAAAYVVSKGINAERLVAVGYGEKKLKIAAAKTEAQHQANRRTTVKIISNGGKKVAEVSNSDPEKSHLVNSKTNRYYIIIGGFGNLKAAEVKYKELSGIMGAGKIIFPFATHKVYRISVADFARKEDAVKALPKLKKQFGDGVWVLNY
ncbi:outer membrane protein OmpA-like peptidoglycan-associated protein [Pontibacter aydingkolensis]|uniref:OmpA family protein n=1 Tax=Pontibacter aydingkolensis TaxID=1911536 RepID=A0ABS7CWE0_9BACT|nr:OmpA family protein [Pontibacter aydingkolensis]MBW7468169.1 OmpA family protein [Pontibacter aydingkolensis]